MVPTGYAVRRRRRRLTALRLAKERQAARDAARDILAADAATTIPAQRIPAR